MDEKLTSPIDLSDKLLNSAAGPQWKKMGFSEHHGIDLPLSSIRSQNSCGVGEFYDLIPLIDWCATLKMDVIQLLPLNDSGNDPSPYNGLSSCAINPMYLSLHALPMLDGCPELKDKLLEMKQFNTTQRVVYHEVKIHKKRWLRTYFDKIGPKLVMEEDFLRFIKKNGWVLPYALFKTLKDQLEQNSWFNWPSELKRLDKKKYDELLERNWSEVSFHTLLQYLCSTQLKKIRDYAHSKKVLLKGDIPILISPDSADVWHFPELFELNLGAGAPPDMYNKEGQCWGFPLFRWDILKKHHYHWWKERLSFASNFYDIYRIDHVVGFFRIWAIPLNRPSKEGSFIPQDKNFGSRKVKSCSR